MNNCVQCGVEIPEGQRNCSMCYGDPYHGSDGYYLEYLAAQDQKAQEDAEYEALMEEERAALPQDEEGE